MRILGELKISHSVIFDDDKDSKDQKPWNDYIIKSKNTFTRKITMLEGDLETLLGTEKPKSHPERKPQYLLYKWIKNELEPQNKEQAFSIAFMYNFRRIDKNTNSAIMVSANNNTRQGRKFNTGLNRCFFLYLMSYFLR